MPLLRIRGSSLPSTHETRMAQKELAERVGLIRIAWGGFYPF